MESYKNHVCQAKVVSCSFQVKGIVLQRVQPIGEVSKVNPKWEALFKVVQKLNSEAYYLQDA